MKNILFVASEGVPFIKTGGLADVVGSLPKCIDKNYYDVRVILPKYTCMNNNPKVTCSPKYCMSGRRTRDTSSRLPHAPPTMTLHPNPHN